MMISRIRVFDYVGVFDEENIALVTPALTEESSILSTIRPFKPLVCCITGITINSPIISQLTIYPPKQVWLMMFISLVSVSIYFSTSSTLKMNSLDKNKRSLSIGDYVLYTIAILTNQGMHAPLYVSQLIFPQQFKIVCEKKGPVFWQPKQQSRLSFRLTAGVWCLFAFVMVNVYSSTLTAHITNRKMSVPPEDSIQVMEQGILPYLVLDNGLGRDMILV